MLFANCVSYCLFDIIRNLQIAYLYMKGQDILVVSRLVTSGPAKNYAELGKELGMSASEAHAAIRRLVKARLLDVDKKTVFRKRLRLFLLYGVPYVFPATTGEITRGMPTAWAVEGCGERMNIDELPPVWPYSEGTVRGQAVKPLYDSVVTAASKNSQLYKLLALIDVLRLGRARERGLAKEKLKLLLGDLS